MASTGERQVYDYRPLPEGSWTRVIKLRPGQFNDGIQCSFQLIDLGSYHEPYIAISYRWGQGPKTIICDNQPVTVNGNLYGAMQRLRSWTNEVTCWADAISINQNDSKEGRAEKAKQVQMMSLIFSQASRTVADLGPADMSTVVALRRLLGRLSTIHADQIGQNFVLGPGFPALGLPPVSDPVWVVFDALLRNEWFNRVWMIQEFALAQRLEMRIGMAKFPFSAVEAAKKIYRQLQPPLAALQDGGTDWARSQRGMEVMLLIRDMRNTDSTLPLTDLFGMCSNFGATDARDRLYALTGLIKSSPKANNEVFDVDYNENVYEVGVRFAKVLAAASPPSLIWMYAGGKQIDMPSWAPNLESTKQRMPAEGMLPHWRHAEGSPFAAGGRNPPSYSFTTALGKPVLITRGRVVGTIIAISEAYDPTKLDAKPQVLASFGHELIRFEQHARTLVVNSGLPQPFNSQTSTVWDPYWLSLVGGTDNTFTRRPDNGMRNSFTAFARVSDEIADGGGTEDIDDQPEKLAQVIQMQAFLSTFGAAMLQRRLCVTDTKSVGNVTANVEMGDSIVVIPGVERPLIMRNVDSSGVDGTFNKLMEHIGLAYIHGIMDGEAIRQDGDSQMSEIQVV